MAVKINALRCVSCGAPLKHGQDTCPYCGCGLDGVPPKKKPVKTDPMLLDVSSKGICKLKWMGVTFDFILDSFETESYPDTIDVSTLDSCMEKTCIAGFGSSEFTIRGHLV